MEFSYTVLSKSRFAYMVKEYDYVDEVGLIAKDADGELICECMVRWYALGDKLCPRLEIFGDAWQMFFQSSDFYALLRDLADTRGNLTPDQLVVMLNEFAFVDDTRYPVKPDEDKRQALLSEWETINRRMLEIVAELKAE